MTGLMIKGDAATGKVIGRTVVRLPSEVQEFVQRHVLFISTKRTASGMMVRFADHWLPQCVVVLAEDAMRGKWAVDIVAHEIASGRYGSGRRYPRRPMGVSVEAEGFVGALRC